MNVAFPILFLVLGGLSFWLLVESKLKWWIKVVLISTFCLFTVGFWMSMHSFLGWSADGKYIPEKVSVHWAIVKEPNKLSGYEGRIFLLLESSQESPEKFPLLKMFGYKKESIEPRLYTIPYSRQLHEQIQKELMPKLKNGQRPKGRFSQQATSKAGRGDKGKSEKTHGGESQQAEWRFHDLLPSEIHRKPE